MCFIGTQTEQRHRTGIGNERIGQAVRNFTIADTSSVPRPRNASAEITPFELSVFRAVQFDAKILKQFGCLLRTCCFQSGISKPGQGYQALIITGKLNKTIHVEDLPPLDPFLSPPLPIFIKLGKFGCRDDRGASSQRLQVIEGRSNLDPRWDEKSRSKKLRTLICAPFLQSAHSVRLVPNLWE